MAEPKADSLDYAHIGNVGDLTLELSTTLLFELGPDEYEDCFKIFTDPDDQQNPFYHQELGKSIKHRPEIHKFRVRMLEEILKSDRNIYTPRRLNDHLKYLIGDFPTEVFFLKKLIDRNTPYNARLFLLQNPVDRKGCLFLLLI